MVIFNVNLWEWYDCKGEREPLNKSVKIWLKVVFLNSERAREQEQRRR